MAEGQGDPDLANLPKLNPVPAHHKVLSIRPNAVYELNTLAGEAINLLASMIIGLREIRQKIKPGSESDQEDSIKTQEKLVAARLKEYDDECARVESEYQLLEDEKNTKAAALQAAEDAFRAAKRESEDAMAKLHISAPIQGTVPAAALYRPLVPPTGYYGGGATQQQPTQPSAPANTTPPPTHPHTPGVSGIAGSTGSTTGGPSAQIPPTQAPPQAVPPGYYPYMYSGQGSSNQHESIQQTSNWTKVAPKYSHDHMPWSNYIDKLLNSKRTYPAITDEQAKTTLYGLLEGNANKLASGHMNPINFPGETLQEYIKRLGNIFQPPGDSDQARLNFAARLQAPGETPSGYYADKQALFLRAYPDNLRDWRLFYDQVIDGLLNAQMRDYLRLHLPTPLNELWKFGESMQWIATVVQKKLKAGEISDQEALGSEPFTSGHEYNMKPLNQTRPGINQLGGNQRRGNGAPKACYHCQSTEHFVAQCPRKAAGLPAAVQALPNQTGQQNVRFQGQMRFQQGNQGSKNRGRGRGRGGSTRGSGRGKGQNRGQSNAQTKGSTSRVYEHNGKRGRVVFIPCEESGAQQYEELDPYNMELFDVEQNVNHVEEEHQEPAAESSDYASGPFLGTGQ